MDKENATKLDDMGVTSLVLTVLTLLILGTYIYFVFVNYSYVRLPWDLVWNGISICIIFSVLLSTLSIIVGIRARKRDSIKQKKVPNMCISIGILGIITSVGLTMFFLNWFLGIL